MNHLAPSRFAWQVLPRWPLPRVASSAISSARSLRSTTTYALRVAGACALLLALGFLVAEKGWSIGLVMFSGHTSIAAGIVLCALIGQARIAR